MVYDNLTANFKLLQDITFFEKIRSDLLKDHLWTKNLVRIRYLLSKLKQVKFYKVTMVFGNINV